MPISANCDVITSRTAPSINSISSRVHFLPANLSTNLSVGGAEDNTATRYPSAIASLRKPRKSVEIKNHRLERRIADRCELPVRADTPKPMRVPARTVQETERVKPPRISATAIHPAHA